MKITPEDRQKYAADSIRHAARHISEDDDMHHGEHFGEEACLGCRWRARLITWADELEAESPGVTP